MGVGGDRLQKEREEIFGTDGNVLELDQESSCIHMSVLTQLDT